jgi:monofunctional biosynthetic peptidoglycan transglycosylase
MEDFEKQKIKKRVKQFSIFFTISFFLVVGFIYLSYVQKITDLKDHYVSFTVNKDGTADYKWEKKRPLAWVPIRFISKDIIHAIVISEDWAFFDHKGYDANQIKKALEDWLDKEKGLRGASTITQQLAKNIFLSGERSLIRKLKELVLSIMLENYLTKRKILEVYLNVIEFGRNTYGIKAATQKYFQKFPHMINPREAAFIAMLLPNPKKYSQSFREKKLTVFAEKRIRDILNKMEKAKYLTEMQLEWSLGTRFSWEPVPYTEESIWDIDSPEIVNDGEGDIEAKEEESVTEQMPTESTSDSESTSEDEEILFKE